MVPISASRFSGLSSASLSPQAYSAVWEFVIKISQVVRQLSCIQVWGHKINIKVIKIHEQITSYGAGKRKSSCETKIWAGLWRKDFLPNFYQWSTCFMCVPGVCCNPQPCFFQITWKLQKSQYFIPNTSAYLRLRTFSYKTQPVSHLRKWTIL